MSVVAHRLLAEFGSRQVKFASKDFTTEVMLISQPPGTSAILSATLTNGSPNITLADPQQLRDVGVHPMMTLYEDKAGDGVNLQTAHTILTVDPKAATNHLVLTANYTGSTGATTIWVKKPETSWRWVVDAWQLNINTATDFNFDAKAIGDAAVDINEWDVLTGDNSQYGSFIPIELTADKALALTGPTNGTDVSLLLYAHMIQL